MQELVDRFVEGHARIKRPPLEANGQDGETGEGYASGNVIYEDISVARGSFLVQQAMRVSLLSSYSLELCCNKSGPSFQFLKAVTAENKIFILYRFS